MDHFLSIHYNQVSDQASYKNSCFFSFGGLGVCWFFLFVLGLTILTAFFKKYYYDTHRICFV